MNSEISCIEYMENTLIVFNTIYSTNNIKHKQIMRTMLDNVSHYVN